MRHPLPHVLTALHVDVSESLHDMTCLIRMRPQLDFTLSLPLPPFHLPSLPRQAQGSGSQPQSGAPSCLRMHQGDEIECTRRLAGEKGYRAVWIVWRGVPLPHLLNSSSGW